MLDLRNLRLAIEIRKNCKYVKVCKGGSRFVSKLIGKSYKHLDYLAQPEEYKESLFK